MDQLVWKRLNDQNAYCNIRVLDVDESDYMIVKMRIGTYFIKSEQIERKILDEYKQASQTYGIAIPANVIPCMAPNCSIFYDNEKITNTEFATRIKHPATFKIAIRIAKINNIPRLNSCVYSIVSVNTRTLLPSVVPNHFLDMLTPESKKCSICTEPIEADLHVTVCCHLFHKACVSKWIAEHKTCPICRAKQ